VALKGGACTFVPAFPVDQIDATGAGDGFGCGLVSALAAGENLDAALRKASACGALVASRKGVFDALPHAGDLENFLKSRSTARG
jgi:ribokinase